jgi:hypothetical protein
MELCGKKESLAGTRSYRVPEAVITAAREIKLKGWIRKPP